MRKTKQKPKTAGPEIRVLIAYNGGVFPFSVVRPASKKLVKMSHESASNEGDAGKYILLLLNEGQAALRELLDEAMKGSGKDRMKWGLKISTIDDPGGQARYKVEDA